MSISSCQFDAIDVLAPLRVLVDRLSSLGLARHIKGSLFGLMLTLFASVIVYGDEMPQGWVPEALIMPDDAEVQMDRAVGSSIRIFSFSTEADAEALLDDWSAVLEENGYTIRPRLAGLEASVLEFSGPGIQNAKIAAGSDRSGDRVVITFDASLE